MADAENVDITLAEVARRLSHSPRWLRVILAYDPPNWLRSARERTQAMVKRAYQAVAPRATADHCQFPVAPGCRRWRGPSSSAKPNRKRSPRKTISRPLGGISVAVFSQSGSPSEIGGSPRRASANRYMQRSPKSPARNGGRLKRENRDVLDQCGKPIAARGRPLSTASPAATVN